MKSPHPDQTTSRPARVATFIALLAITPAFAGVTVTQNVGPGATSWPDTPILSTVANPSSQLAVGESFGGATSNSETFTVPGPNNYSLQTIYLYVGGGTGTSATAPAKLNLFDLGGRIAPNPSSYAAGTNLFGGGNGLSITYTTQANGLLRLDFDGSDEVQLVAGHMYAFELAGNTGTTPINWLRTIADIYPGGAAYRNRNWINGTNARDFGLAVYGVINTDPVPPTQCTVNAGTTYQQIDGFGAGAVFLDAGLDPLTDAQMDALYGTGPNQMGLTLIRLRISPFGPGDWNNQIADGQKAHLRGAKILATPWTPPASMKDNNNIVQGSLLPTQYPNFVNYLNSFTDTMAANGAPVSVVSLQNEPDFAATYESCLWTATQFQTFCRDFAGGITAPVMMPESFFFNQALSNPTLNDPLAATNVDYIGGHLYGGTIQDYPLAHSLGKHTWMTEYLLNDQTIGSAVGTGWQISDCLTVGNMSAYIWWKTIGNANGLLDASGVLQKRAYVMAQFSRFARPGDLRIDVSNNTSPLGISAFKDPVTGHFAIVAVNDTTVAVPQKFTTTGLTTASVTPWVTSAAQSLEQQAALPIANDVFTYNIPAFSVVTFAGTDSPAITSGPSASAIYGQPFSFQITATNSPTNYSATGLPPGLDIDPVSGLITGTPNAVGQYSSTIVATNDGGSDAIDFTITVLKANATVTISGLEALYDGTPRSVSVTTSPPGLTVIVTYNDSTTPPTYPGFYTVVATIDDPNYTGSATAILEIDVTGRVRHMTSLDGSIDASIQVVTPENSALNGSASISGDLLVPGTPQVVLNGSPTYAGTIDGPGAADPATATITLNRGTVLRHVVRHIDPLALPVVAAPPLPTGTRSVALDKSGQSPGDFATLRDLTLDSNVGLIAVPAGTYGNFTADRGSGFVLGVAGATEPAVYNLQSLALNSGSSIQIAGPVILVLNAGLSVSNNVAFSAHAPEWFMLKFASGGLTLNGSDVLPAIVIAPNGAVTLNGYATLRGKVKADRLIVNTNASLEKP